MTTVNTAMLNLSLPWQPVESDEKRFRTIAAIGLVLFLIFAIGVPLVPLPDRLVDEKEAPKPDLAKIILEKQEIPKPEEKKPEPKPEPEKPKPKPEPKEIPVETKPAPPKIDNQEKIKSSGLLQFQDDLQDFRNKFDTNNSNRSLTTGDATAAQVDRSVVANKAKTTSGGFNTATVSRDTGGIALSGKENTVVDSEIYDAEGTSVKAAPKPGSKQTIGGRSDRDVRVVMDKNKGAVNAIYNRELRKDPSLQGKMTIRLVIEPDGSVSSVTIVSSDLGSDTLESKLLARIRLIDFGAKNVAQTTVNYTLNLFPA